MMTRLSVAVAVIVVTCADLSTILSGQAAKTSDIATVVGTLW